jgi:hypothetical protein
MDPLELDARIARFLSGQIGSQDDVFGGDLGPGRASILGWSEWVRKCAGTCCLRDHEREGRRLRDFKHGSSCQKLPNKSRGPAAPDPKVHPGPRECACKQAGEEPQKPATWLVPALNLAAVATRSRPSRALSLPGDGSV